MIRTSALFSREVEDAVQHITAHFTSHPQLVSGGHSYDFEQLSSDLNLAVLNFNSRGSNFVLDFVTSFTIVITQFRPMSGSTYIKTPSSIAKKQAVINVRNYDNRCFQWSILACLYPSKSSNPCHVSNYRQYDNTLNFDGISFPVKVNQISKFEKNNPDISVNVISLDSDDKNFCVEYLSKERNRKYHVNLLLIDDPDSQIHHYVYIKHFSRLLGSRTKAHNASYVCNSCLNVFASQQVLDSHIPNCLQHAAQQVQYPTANESKLKFQDRDKQHALKFYLVADFESFLTPTADDDGHTDTATRIIDEHNVSGFCCYRVTSLSQYETPPTVYSGPDVMSRFYEHVTSESKTINEILARQTPLLPMSDDDLARHRAATKCANCNCLFTHKTYKVKHHDHVTGEYLFPACYKCNLQLKPKKCKSAGTEKDSNSYFLPIIFHNLKNYDSHYVIKHFQKQYTRKRHSKGQQIVYDDVEVIPLNAERYLQFQIGNVRFLDSYQFLSTSLENLVALLLKSGKHNFPHTAKYLGDTEFTFCKGIYPYSYVTDRSKFDDTQLPPIENFHDTLHDEPLSSEDYQRAHQIWNFYNIQNMRQYHDHYLLSDVLLLTDVFENFRQNIMQKHNLDCLYYPTLPSLAWSVALKYTGIELDLITDEEQYLMIENSIRGGLSTISNRYSKANNPLLEDFDPEQPTTYITYLDANNLYGQAQSEPLPVGDFRFLDRDEIIYLQREIMNISEDSPEDYIIDCDLTYPEHLHDLHSDYPLAPEHLTVTREMLSPFTRNLAGRRWRPTEKLVPNLYDKSHYVTHYRNLQFYIKHGLVLTKIHRVLSFTQYRWLKKWIDFCTAERQNAQSEFDSDLAKLQINATFGKTMEQVRNRVNIRLIADPNKLRKAVSKPSYRQAQIINSDLVMVRAAAQKILLNKPIAVGFCILELSKVTMYKFYYDYMKPKYQDRCMLLFTDTDSLCCQIETPDLYHDMGEKLDLFDTSNFDPNHPLYSRKNHRVLGKMKSETGSDPPVEFVGLRAKMYSLLCGIKSQKKTKGIQKSYVKKHVQHQSFLKVLKNASQTTTAKFRAFKSTNHVLNTVEISKLCLCAMDDKRYVLDDGERTLAYGHYLLRS